MVFVVSVFLIKSPDSNFKNQNSAKNNGLSYDEEVVGDLISKDTDGDGVVDWEENLWGTDITRKDTDGDGVEDGAETRTLKAAQGLNSPDEEPENLTQTDKFSRELFATVATLSQEGELDPVSVEKITSSLESQITNNTIKKIYTSKDMNIVQDNSIQAAQKYNIDLGNLEKKYAVEKGAIQILEDATDETGEMDPEILSELTPLIKNIEGRIKDMLAVSTPSGLASPHLNLINAMQGCLENLKDIQIFESDVIVALGGVSKFSENSTLLEEATLDLKKAIWDKIKSI